MPKLYFKYGTMNSGKTSQLLMVAHNYKSQGKSVILLKPDVDHRFGVSSIHSRIGVTMQADVIVGRNDDILSIIVERGEQLAACILVDECQFLEPAHINQLRVLAEYTPVICYGLKTDYLTNLFPGAKRLMELADSIEEIRTICKIIINA